MYHDLLDILFRVAEGAFVDVTVFASVALLFFSYFNFKNDGAFIKVIKKNKKFQPLIGACLGLTPGCGGAILIAPLYIKKTVTFGTIIATLIATMGDASFLLMTKSPKIFIILNVTTFIVGVTSGYIVDYLNIQKYFNLNTKSIKQKISHKFKFKNNICKSIALKNQCHFHHIGHKTNDEIDLALHHKAKGHQSINTIGFKITHNGYLIYFILLILGLIIGIANILSFDIENENLSQIISIIGIIGTFGSILLMFAGHKYFSEHTHEEEELKLASLKETIIHAIEDIAFIGTWVFVGFFAYELIIYFIENNLSFSKNFITHELNTSSTYYAIIIGSLVGIIPGCGPQIIFVSLYLKGILPIEALIAHSISQDGDALLPLIAMDTKSSLVLTIITTIIALIVGFLLMLI